MGEASVVVVEGMGRGASASHPRSGAPSSRGESACCHCCVGTKGEVSYCDGIFGAHGEVGLLHSFVRPVWRRQVGVERGFTGGGYHWRSRSFLSFTVQCSVSAAATAIDVGTGCLGQRHRCDRTGNSVARTRV